jgi:hypothetical protein
MTVQAKLYRHKSVEKRVLVEKLGTLTFNDSAKKLSFRGNARDNVDIQYDGVTKVVFDISTRMRGGAGYQALMATGLPGLMAGKAISRHHIHNYWFYIEYGNQDQKLLFEVPHEVSKEVIDKATSVFQSRVVVSNYQDNGEQVDPAKLPDINSKQTVRIDKGHHPIPEIKPDKALVVLVCPPLATRYAGRGNQFKLHANDQVIAVNKEGTYSFAYLDPGKYKLISQSENAYALDTELEAGHSYYFLQNTFDGMVKYETSLSRNSPELVNYLLDGSYFSDWKSK